ncbi:MAG: acyl-CoA synthetase FdrA, partial [Dehalococcoidia bacterium]
MPVSIRLLKNTYFDSVYLMGLGGRLAKQPGVTRNAALMATPANKAMLEEFGVSAAELDTAGPTDLVLVADAGAVEQADAALALVDGWLAESIEEFAGETAASLDGALHLLPEANLAVISVPGDYAGFEAKRALEKGLHVFLFSDNVSLDDELELKQLGAAKGLLVMGPDCGTAIIAGVGVGFANAVRRGSIGVVGPSGTGIQQVSCLIDRAGAGVSHAIGAGGRDLSDAIGGITTLQALDALAEDEQTEVILVVSKPAGPHTRRRILDWIANSPKPVVTCFLGLDETPVVGKQHTPERTLAAAANAAADLTLQPRGRTSSDARWTLGSASRDAALGQRCVRGLFAGGTFCYEA